MTWTARDLLGGLPDRLTHAPVVAVAAEGWQLESVCRFFTLRVEDAAVEVNGLGVRVGWPNVERLSPVAVCCLAFNPFTFE